MDSHHQMRTDLLLQDTLIDHRRYYKEAAAADGECTGSDSHLQTYCDWSGLTGDALRLIIHRLSIVDRMSISRVCWPWRNVVLSVGPHHGLRYGLPCLVYLNSSTSASCHLLDPINRHNKHTFEIPTSDENATILFSRDGWLLVSRTTTMGVEDDRNNRSFDMALLNIFSKARIDLPTLKTPHSGQFSLSSRPTSPSCLVVGFLEGLVYCAEICFCRPGDAQWTIVERDCGIHFLGFLTNPTWCSGRFYCLDARGNLGAFDPSEQYSWTITAKQDDLGVRVNRSSQQYLVESEGDLLRVVVCDDGDPPRGRSGGGGGGNLSPIVSVFRLAANSTTDTPQGGGEGGVPKPKERWVPVKDLGDRALFIGRQDCASAIAVVGSIMRGKVYFPRVWEGLKGDVVIVSRSLDGTTTADSDANNYEVTLEPAAAAASSSSKRFRDFTFSSWVDLEYWSPPPPPPPPQRTTSTTTRGGEVEEEEE